jgi:hypothetical protein
MEVYLGAMIRQVDSSLLDEWQKMRQPHYATRVAMEKAGARGLYAGTAPAALDEGARDITRDPKAFTAEVRVRLFGFLRALVIGEFQGALDALSQKEDLEGQPWNVDRLRAAMDAYHASHERICLDPNARNIRHTYVIPSEDKKTWRIQQMIVDPDELNDWVAEFGVDLDKSRSSGEPFLRLLRLAALA